MEQTNWSRLYIGKEIYPNIRLLVHEIMLIPKGKSWHHLHDVLFVSDKNGKFWLYCVWMFRKLG
ncbi:hypothetical protein NTGZN8_90073 [Candidatus Nitrotoga fabula]|uniref:Uncharacterized protein n=1 Tax=Candidatus Nitrotoga fabula TaxID=2182327 RepID=A0A916BE13_9PROT|nr:hypothetical protein NTGZN8_90073 [Candidatus Nitrotoga fabula]